MSNIKKHYWLIAIASVVSVSILSYSYVHRNSFSEKNEIQFYNLEILYRFDDVDLC